MTNSQCPNPMPNVQPRAPLPFFALHSLRCNRFGHSGLDISHFYSYIFAKLAPFVYVVKFQHQRSEVWYFINTAEKHQEKNIIVTHYISKGYDYFSQKKRVPAQ